MQLAAIRTALATVSVPGFKSYRSAVDVGDIPAIVVGQVSAIKYTSSYGGSSEIELPVRVIVSRADEQSAQTLLDAAMSLGHEGSVVDALRDVVGPWRTMTVNSASEPFGVTVGTAEAIEVVFTLSISARKDQ